MATTPAFCDIVLIGCLSLSDRPALEFILTKGASTNEVRPALERFWGIASAHDAFVTYNGMNFDVPLLEFHSKIAGVKPTRRLSYQPNPDPNREIHFDVMRLAFGHRTRGGTLGNLGAALGLHDRETADGSSVKEWVRQGAWERLKDYNYNDLRLTAEAFVKLGPPSVTGKIPSLPPDRFD